MKAMLRRLRTMLRVAEAGVWMSVAWLAFDVFRSRLSFRLFSQAQGAPETVAEPVAPPDARLHLIVSAVRYGARRVPFRCVCLHQGIAADRMLRRRGLPSCMHYGMARGEEGWKSHIWVTSAGHAVVGAREAPLFTEVVRFVEPSEQNSHSDG